jgi:adenylate kinase family enzyme
LLLSYNGVMEYDVDAISELFISHVHNLDHPNNKLYVAFSAVTGSGKTWLAERISKYFSGLYLSADNFRTAAQELYPTISRSELDQLVARYAPSIQDRLLTYPNHLHVVDTNIDKYAQQVFDKAKAIEYPLFVIRLDVDRMTLVERITSRDQNKFQDEKTLLDALDQNIKCHEDFFKNFGEHISYNYSYTKDEGLDKLLTRISKSMAG